MLPHYTLEGFDLTYYFIVKTTQAFLLLLNFDIFGTGGEPG
jgi:hypothetical protein